MSLPRGAWAIVAAAVPVHFVLALATDLSPDEAYYLAAARQPGGIPPLVDHPPLLPWLLRCSDALGGPIELRVRLWAILFSAATGIACVELSRRRGAGREGCLLAAWVGTFALLPMAGGFVTTPDGAALLAIATALLFADDSLTLRRAALAAPILLLGALAKVIVLPIALVLAVTARRAPLPARLLLALGPLVALPLLLPSLRFQVHHAFQQGAAAGWSLPGALGAVLAAVIAQALLWSPLVLWRGVIALPRLPRSDRAVVLTLSALLLVSALARAVPPEPNWWAPAALIMVAGAAIAAFSTPRRRWGMILSVVLPTAVATAHTLRPFLPLPPPADPTARLHGWSRGAGPEGAAGVGLYGAAAERCVYLGDCDEIRSYFKRINLHE